VGTKTEKRVLEESLTRRGWKKSPALGPGEKKPVPSSDRTPIGQKSGSISEKKNTKNTEDEGKSKNPQTRKKACLAIKRKKGGVALGGGVGSPELIGRNRGWKAWTCDGG